jgi:hypothetical protein
LIGWRWPEIFRLLPEGLPPSRSDEHGFRIKSGMTEKGRTADRGRLRFNSREMMVETEAVMEKIYRVVVERAGM